MLALSQTAERDGLPGVTSAQHFPADRVPRVAILMCTYNGAEFLTQQVESFERQHYRHWDLYVSDDGSSDATRLILKRYAQRWDGRRLTILEGPRAGFARNFLSLTCHDSVRADYFAWSDQDDIWCAHKLQVAVNWLSTTPDHVPALYCGRTQLVSENGNPIGLSPHFALAPQFRNALVQSLSGGNTMVFNQAARALIMEAGAGVNIPSHDWWLYQLITGAGGIVHYDAEPHVFYRQHGNNVIGSNQGWAARARRLVQLFQGRFHEWNAQNIQALESMSHRLVEDNRKTLGLFKTARKQNLPRRMLYVRKAGLRRQTWLGNVGLLVATLAKKI